MKPVRELVEKMGSRPAWMKVKKYAQSGNKAELILGLGPAKSRKDYWFPVTPSVYRKFTYHISESRSRGLKYLQKYIRRYRGYTGTWPDAEYTESNKISKTLLTEAPIATQVSSLFLRGRSLRDISEDTYLPENLLVAVLKAQGVYLPDDYV